MKSFRSNPKHGGGLPSPEPDGVSPPITRLLREVEAATPGAEERAWRQIYPELLRLAASQRRRWDGDWTLDTRSLANEAYIRFFGSEPAHFENRRHFFLAVSRGIRRILINYSLKRGAAKRGGRMVRVPLVDRELPTPEGQGPDLRADLATLAEVLERFEDVDPRASQVVHLRFFAGLTEEETAELLEVSRSTVSRDWAAARAWLWREMTADRPQTDEPVNQPGE